MREIENRIRKAEKLAAKIDQAQSEIDPDGEFQKTVSEDIVTNVLAELLESLKNGESLEIAILTIHENF